MLILGHVGLTLLAARAVDPEVDARAAALFSIGPDLIDKPIGWLLPDLVRRNSRSFGHTLLASLAVLAALTAVRGRVRRPWLLWGCYAGHAVLDRMWLYDYPVTYLWPLLGGWPARKPPLAGYRGNVAYDAAGEAAGLAILLALAWRGRLFGRPRPAEPLPPDPAQGRPPRRILFVCTGNVCRSAMAEQLLRYMAGQRGLPLEAASCGTAVERGLEVPAAARRLLSETGVPPFEHRPRLVTRDALRWADLVLVMTRGHREDVLERFPEFTSKIRLLNEHAGVSVADLADPMGASDEEFAACLDQIRAALEAMLTRDFGN